MKTFLPLVVVAASSLAGAAFANPPAPTSQLSGFAAETGQPLLLQLPPPPGTGPLYDRDVERRSDQPPGVSDAELEQTLRNIQFLNDTHERNQAVERCLQVNLYRLSFRQIERILQSVASTDYDSYHTYDRQNSIQRIVARYLEAWSHSMPASQAVRLANWNGDSHEANARIEGYFHSQASVLHWDEVETLLDGVRSTDYDSYHTNDRQNAIERITRAFLSQNGRRLDPRVAVEAAHWNQDGHIANQLIEGYFHAAKGGLSQADVEHLLASIRSTDYDSYHTYDKESTKQRIVRAWGCPLCP